MDIQAMSTNVIESTSQVLDAPPRTDSSGASDVTRESANPLATLILERVSALEARASLLDALHAECRRYAENAHLHNAVLPMARGLIAIDDRRRQNAAAAREQAKLHTDPRLRAAYADVVRAHQADRIDVEELLHILGVVSFRTVSDRFDASMHKCLSRVPTSVVDAHLTIAHRHLPGYRRGELVVRPEYVTVHVHTPAATGPDQRRST